MGKLAQNFAKYLIYASLQTKGVVEKPDVIGAIFGQTEGLLGTDLDLRELQRTGRIGRIDVNVKTSRGKSFANVIIPSSLDACETSLIAASLETIDKIGPCDAKIEVQKVEDVRGQKRRYVIERAKDILRSMLEDGMPNSQKIAESIKQAVRAQEVSNYYGLSCGPDILNSDEIIVVEGRADVINMLKNGIRNVIAIEGSKIPEPIVQLTKEKITTAFLDGDRGGDLDLKKLLSIAEIDFVARADPGKEVEELTKKQIFKALREKIPVDQLRETKNNERQKNRQRPRETEELSEERRRFVKNIMEQLIGTRAATLIDKNLDVLTKVPMNEITSVINNYSDIYILAFDGKINQDIVDLAKHRNIPVLVGMSYKHKVRARPPLQIFTLKDLK
jgi:DNA primase